MMEEIYECDECGNQDYLEMFPLDTETGKRTCPDCGATEITPVEPEDDEE